MFSIEMFYHAELMLQNILILTQMMKITTWWTHTVIVKLTGTGEWWLTFRLYTVITRFLNKILLLITHCKKCTK
jgi:hypothetical protein